MYNPANHNTAGSPSSNRRRKTRVKVSTTALVWPAYEASYNTYGAGRNDLQVSMLESLSTTGLSFWSPNRYECGNDVWIRFRIGTRTCQLRAVVRHIGSATLKTRPGYTCGVEFMECQQTTQAQQIVASYLTPTQAAGLA